VHVSREIFFDKCICFVRRLCIRLSASMSSLVDHYFFQWWCRNHVGPKMIFRKVDLRVIYFWKHATKLSNTLYINIKLSCHYQPDNLPMFKLVIHLPFEIISLIISIKLFSINPFAHVYNVFILWRALL